MTAEPDLLRAGVTHLSLDQVAWAFPPTPRASLPSLTHLRLADTRCLWGPSPPLLVAVSCSALTRLIIENFPWGLPPAALDWEDHGLSRVAPQLETLALAECEVRVSDELPQLAPTLANLRRLRVSADSLPDRSAGLADILERLPRSLATLELDAGLSLRSFARTVCGAMAAEQASVSELELIKFWGDSGKLRVNRYSQAEAEEELELVAEAAGGRGGQVEWVERAEWEMDRIRWG